jgi:branched-chain amino acid transport system substrate-binding protein
MRTKTYIGLGALLGSLALPAIGQSQDAGTVNVGFTGPLTGSAASYGIGMSEGIKMAFAVAGPVMIGGKPYRFTLDALDDAYNTQTAVANAQRLIQEQHVKFAATMGGAIGVATEPVFSASNVLQFHLGAAETFLGSNKPLSLRSHMSSLDAFFVYWPWIAKNYPEVKNVALFQPQDDTGRQSKTHEEEAVGQVGLKIVDYELVPRDTTDFYPILTKVLGTKPDAISVYTPPGQQPIVAKQARELGFKGLLILPSMEPGSVVSALGPQADGILDPVALTMPLTDKAHKVQTEWAQAHDSKPPTLLFDGYNIGEMLIKAATDAGTVDDPERVNASLHKVGFNDTIFGKMCWHEVRGINNAMYNSDAIAVLKNGKQELLATAQPPCK